MQVHVYAILGQSNAEGVGPLPDFDNHTDPDILMISRENELLVAKAPVNYGKQDSGDPQCVGPGIAFARKMRQARPDARIALINLGAGGTKLSQWSQGGGRYNLAVRRLTEAKQLGTVKGVIWHQGESDSKEEELATTYVPRFLQMVNDLRSAVELPELPFVAGQIGPFVETNTSWNNVGFPFARIVNQQILSLSKHGHNIVAVSSQGTSHIGDELHFDTASQVLMGERYAEQMLLLTSS